ncbi:MAG: bifunctional NADP-dependent methylenetetrahydromethanopterin dehydrogenase/methylenetetrahydrofolate dehydrogenase [Planctomycetaceae bacterium]|nr:bifunctional NADP-dependent methylenetetrahydromethanopterin dehydrogenase/methylenetetrahydrofolate dehydrogenase [Planctomycetaceae bacterium]|tara:strand:+ start:985 stop:1860 length:876 start_codon:yes stop_codon:yes gene_type:complete
MSKPKILVQLDSDKHASNFDAVVAVDSGIDQLFQYSQVASEDVQGLIHGAMFTRGIQDLQQTAVFVGGSNVAVGEDLMAAATKCFFGPMRVSVMMDSNGSNTTAAAAVLATARHVDLKGAKALVLAGTGPVGLRAGRLLAGQGASVKLGSRSKERAQKAADSVISQVEDANVVAVSTATEEETALAADNVDVIIAAGAAGVQLISQTTWINCDNLKVLVDLNAVPPLGIEGVEMNHKAEELENRIVYGAIGVGGTKMKIHKAAIARLFESNDQILDAEEIYAIGERLESSN